jgi:branched-chain amino acid transport system permease protein
MTPLSIGIDFWTGSVLRAVYIGSLYAIMALGLTITYASSKYPNFAHGDLITIGGYAAGLLTSRFGWNFIPATLAAAALGAILAFSMFKFAFLPLMKTLQNFLMLLVATVAVSLLLESVMNIVAPAIGVPLVQHAIPQVVLFRVANAPISNVFLMTVPTMFALMVLLTLFLKRTKIGKAMRGLSSNAPLAEACGINTDRVQYVAWMLGGALAGVGGSFLALNIPISPTSGLSTFVEFFPATIIGGMVSVPATIAGAFLVGLAENPLMDSLNLVSGVSYAFKPLVAFSLAVIVILIRPTGLVDLRLPFKRTITSKLNRMSGRKGIARIWRLISSRSR